MSAVLVVVVAVVVWRGEGGYGKEHKSVLWALFYSPLPPVFLTTPVQLRLLQWPERAFSIIFIVVILLPFFGS